jgi:5'(3')-deoxyribonucleotidase
VKPIVGIDVDGVLADFVKGFFQLSRDYLHKPGLDVTEADNWDFVGQISESELDLIWQKIKYSTVCTNWWTTLDKLPNTDNLTKACQDFDVVFVTNKVSTRGFSPETQVKIWLLKEYLIKQPRIVVSKGEKGPVAQELGLQWFIDDRDKNCVSVKNTVSECQVYLQNQRYNRGFNRADIPRINSLNEFLSLIR